MNRPKQKLFFTAKTSGDNPFNGIDLGSYAQTNPTFTDIDGDNKIDLVVGEKDGILHYYRNESTESTIVFTDKTESNNPLNGINIEVYSKPTFADINGDNKTDLVVGEYTGSLSYYLNESTQDTITLTEKTGNENPFDGMSLGSFPAPIFADITGDNKLDLVVGGSDGTLSYFLNESTTETISFTAKTGASDNPFHNFDVGSSSAPTFADVDGDNKLDLVVGESDGDLNYYLNESTTSTIAFTAKTEAGNNPFHGLDVSAASVPAFADINGDNKIDLIVGGTEGFLKYFLNESTTSTIVFTEKTGIDNLFYSIDVGSRSSPAFADIDGDGDLELMVGNQNGAIFTIFNHYGSWVPFL